MKFSIQTMNKIAQEGLDLLPENFSYGEDVKDPDAILVRSAKVNTSDYPSILAVGRAGVGFNNISVSDATKKGVCVFNTPGANANAVAELVISMMGYAARNIGQGVEFAQSLNSEKDDESITKLVEANKSKYRGFELLGKSLAVIGLGKIGVLVSNYAIKHGMKVKAYDPFPTITNIHYLDPKVNICGSFSEVVSGAELLTVHVPLADKTRGLVGADGLDLVKPGCFVLNFARDGIVDDEAMEAALESGQVGQFITDFPKKRFLAHPKVLNTPHLGASTSESEENCALMAVTQIKNYLAYGNIVNSVNFPVIEAPVQKATKFRLIVINEDIPNMISNITQIIGEEKLNIVSFNNESNGKIGYNIIDLESDIPQHLVSNIEKLGSIIKVRLLKF